LGLVLIDGVLGREVAIGEHHILELLCHTDVLLIPAAAEPPRIGTAVTLTVLTASTLAVLSRSFIRAAGRWPSLLSNLHRRVEAQRARLAIQGLTAHPPQAEHRVLLTLWLMADACGHVTADGIVLQFAFTHNVLGRLAAARRPTVTLALRRLQSADCIRRDRHGRLILTSAAAHKVTALTETSNAAAWVGSSITFRALVNGTGSL